VRDWRTTGRPKVLLVNIGFLPQVGGSYVSLFHLARGLPHGVLDVLTSHAKGDETFDRESGLAVRRSMLLTLTDVNGTVPWIAHRPIYGNRVGRFLQRLNPIFYPVMALQFLRVMIEAIRRDYRLLWTGQAVPTGWMGWGIRKILQVPYCTFVYGEDVRYFLGRRLTPGKFLLRRTLKEAHLIVANSESTRRETVRFCEEGGFPLGAERVRVITPGVDTELFRPLDVDLSLRGDVGVARRPTLITVSRLTPQKGVDRVVRVMPDVLSEFPDALYLIRGDGPHEGLIRRLARDLGISRHVRFLRRVSYAELPYVYALGDVFVLPGRVDRSTGESEGFGTVLLEAAACGLPVVGGRIGGMGEAVEDGSTGYLVTPDDDEELRERILGLLRDRAGAREMGLVGRDRVVKKFGWDRRSAELWSSMKGIMEG
jgi:phosphatidylinositol alpha-1,6-mannosyltransferase